MTTLPTPATLLAGLTRKRLLRLAQARLGAVPQGRDELTDRLADALTASDVLAGLTVAEWRTVCAREGITPDECEAARQPDLRALVFATPAIALPSSTAARRASLARDHDLERRRRRRAQPLPPFTTPRTRAQCLDGPRPCPHTTCRYHLGLPYAELPKRQGGRPRAVSGPPRRRTADTCVLDVIDSQAEECTLAQVADQLGITRERVRQIEKRALLTLARTDRIEAIAGAEQRLRDYHED